VQRSVAGELPEGTRILEARAFDGGYVKHFFASLTWPEDYANWRKEREALAAGGPEVHATLADKAAG
jgi:hypothetical protein